MKERGSVTAEFAAALPAVAVALVGCLAGLQVAGQQVRLQDAAAIAARSIARGETDVAALGRARQLAEGAQLATTGDGDLECAILRQPASGPPGLLRLTLVAKSCSLGAGE